MQFCFLLSSCFYTDQFYWNLIFSKLTIYLVFSCTVTWQGVQTDQCTPLIQIQLYITYAVILPYIIQLTAKSLGRSWHVVELRSSVVCCLMFNLKKPLTLLWVDDEKWKWPCSKWWQVAVDSVTDAFLCVACFACLWPLMDILRISISRTKQCTGGLSFFMLCKNLTCQFFFYLLGYRLSIASTLTWICFPNQNLLTLS